MTTSAGTVQFPLTGTGQQAAAHLSIGRILLDFGGLPVGGTASDSVALTNDGSQPLTFSSVTGPAAPFAASGLPAVGSTLAAGASITVAVDFAPTATGTFTDQLAFDAGTAGSGTVQLSGTASNAGHLTISRLTVPYGNVRLGDTVAQSFTVTNDGGSSITITKSKPPITGPFLATGSLDEGTVLAAGASRTITVNFTPSALGPAQDGWDINSTDASGVRTVAFTGTGVIQDPSAGRWTFNGAAGLSGSTTVLTPATGQVAGSAVYATPFAAGDFTASFTATMNGGTGADGMTVFFADATKTAVTAIGGDGGALGFGGLSGVAVALDTYKGPVDPSSNFVGVADGAVSGGLHWLATATTGVPSLRVGSHAIRIDRSGGVLSVSIDGARVLQSSVVLPASVRLGLSGATGGLTDVHSVSGFSLTGTAAVPPPSALAADGFTRTVTGGWGSASPGGSYSLVGSPSAFSVNGSAGSMLFSTAGQTREADLPLNVRDVDVTARVRIDKAPAGSNQYAYLLLRRTADGSDGARLRFSTTGHVYASFVHVVSGVESTIGAEVQLAGIVPTPGAWWGVRAEAVGSGTTALRVRLWPDGTSEPAAWSATQTETTASRQVSGGVGLRGYLQPSSTNVPVTFSWDDLTVTAL